MKKLKTAIWRFAQVFKDLDSNDRTLLIGLGLLALGISAQFSIGYACIVLGVVLAVVALKG